MNKTYEQRTECSIDDSELRAKISLYLKSFYWFFSSSIRSTFAFFSIVVDVVVVFFCWFWMCYSFALFWFLSRFAVDSVDGDCYDSFWCRRSAELCTINEWIDVHRHTDSHTYIHKRVRSHIGVARYDSLRVFPFIYVYIETIWWMKCYSTVYIIWWRARGNYIAFACPKEKLRSSSTT